MGLLSWIRKLTHSDAESGTPLLNAYRKLLTLCEEKIRLIDRMFSVQDATELLSVLDKQFSLVGKSLGGRHSGQLVDTLRKMVDDGTLLVEEQDHILDLHEQYLGGLYRQKDFLSKCHIADEQMDNESRRKLLRDEHFRNTVDAELALLANIVKIELQAFRKDRVQDQLLTAAKNSDLLGLQQLQGQIQREILLLSKATNNFADINGSNPVLSNLVSNLKTFLEMLEALDRDSLSADDQKIYDRLEVITRQRLHELNPILRDPVVSPYADKLSYREVIGILRRLKPSHVVSDAKTLLPLILDAGKLQTAEALGLKRNRFVRTIKGTDATLFFSIAGPYSHLSEDPNLAAVIILKSSVLLRKDLLIFPRDSGGYPSEIDESLPLDQQKAAIKKEIQSRTFRSLDEVYGFLFNLIKHHGLVRQFSNVLLSRKIPKTVMTYFPEVSTKSPIPLSQVEAIIVPRWFGQSPEGKNVGLRCHQKKIDLVVSDSPLDAYWSYIGL